MMMIVIATISPHLLTHTPQSLSQNATEVEELVIKFLRTWMDFSMEDFIPSTKDEKMRSNSPTLNSQIGSGSSVSTSNNSGSPGELSYSMGNSAQLMIINWLDSMNTRSKGTKQQLIDELRIRLRKSMSKNTGSK